ncbi:3-dehydroquinate synthase [Porphyromonas crevioricanis]|nr:3-dehydroquinate synthase family protein [Porphyromonas crevioricanis]GAD07378.1 3-dehydroquinate synthase [Porphyromonas crevioricanis JCM 13913]
MLLEHKYLSSRIIAGRACLGRPIADLLEQMQPDKLFALIDEAVMSAHEDLLRPLLAKIPTIRQKIWVIDESRKNLQSCLEIWQWLEGERASRHSLLINIGGGVLTDLGGFAASVFKRGMRTINVPTSLMGMVDAAIGGKTGIDWLGLKNIIGSFHQAEVVAVDPGFLSSLPPREVLSGYVELVKHSLLQTKAEWDNCRGRDPLLLNDSLYDLIEQSARFKANLIAQDPQEGGLRKVLNLGHTIGHAVESLALESDSLPSLTHGEAVLIGLIAETYISHRRYGFPSDELQSLVYFAREYYSPFPLRCNMYKRIVDFAMNDKKNRGNGISFVALRAIGEYVIDAPLSESDIREGLDFYRESSGF